MNKLLISILLSLFTLPLWADKTVNLYLQADLTSAYLWRGERPGGVSIQPSVGVRWKGMHAYLWGNVPLSPPAETPQEHEIDIVVEYTFKPGILVGIRNVYLNTRGNGFLSYGSIPHAANSLDVVAGYVNPHIEVEWTTTVAGYDGYNHNGKRAYGSYFLAIVPFNLYWFDWTARIGVVPYYCSRYSDDVADGFHVNMCSLKMAHSFFFTTCGISLTPYAQLMVNPSSRKAFFEAGVSFVLSPSRRATNHPLCSPE